MFSDHNEVEINNRKLCEKSSNILKLNNILLNNPWDKELKEKLKHNIN